ncbi:hypothetical protein EON64_03310 [archaeon]|nr:MAG: hypothetical protein EON64_03310 [archaeon]
MDTKLPSVLGAGRFAKVHLVRTHRNKYMALKVLRKTKDLFSSNEVRHVHNERNCMYELHSPFCMKLFAEFEDADFIYFALEYTVGGELRNLMLRHNNKLPAPMAKFYLFELFAALEHMHSLGYVHRDLRPENICLDEDGHVKLVDFGYAAHIQSNVNGKLYTICCNPSYLSPELLNSKYQGGYGMEVDLWAFGVLVYELILGGLPFGDSEDISMPEILLNILHHKIHLPLTLEGRTKDLLHKLLEPDAAKRLVDIAQIKSHVFFQEVQDWAMVNDRQLVPPFVPLVRSEGDSSQYPGVVQSVKHWKLAGLENKIQIT